jgi:CRP/FNR family transcriptional regulator
MDLARALQEIPLFKGLPEEHIRRLADIAVIKVFKRGEVIFSEGEEATGFYIVLTGRVKIFKVSPEGKEQVLHIIGFQEPFAEVPVFAGQKYPAHAQTLEEGKMLFFPRAKFVALISEGPDLAMKMLAVLSMRLRQFARLIEELSLKEVPQRLASYLLYLADREEKSVSEVELDISKSLLANMLGTTPETLSRMLTRMSEEGFISVKGRRIHLVKRKALEDLASGARGLG